MRIQTVVISLVLCGAPLAGCGSSSGGASASGGGTAGGASNAQAGMGGAFSTSGGGSGGSSGSSGSAGATQACGADQVSCNGACLGAGMSQAGCSVLVGAGNSVEISFGLALDDGFVYWPEQGTRVAIARVAKTGGARQQLTTTTDVPFAVAVNSNNVFWTESAFATSSIQMMPKAGGTAQALFTDSEADSDLNNAVANETRVYVSRSHFGMASDAISVGFAQQDLLVHGQSGSDGSEISGFTLALDTASVYWLSNTDFTGGQVLRSSLTGMEGQVLTSPSRVAGLVVLNGLAYFVSGNTIESIPMAGGTPAAVFSSADVSGAVFAGSGSSLYFGSASALWRVGTDGSNPTQLLTTTGNLTFAVADSTGVYASIAAGGVFGEGFIVKAGG